MKKGDLSICKLLVLIIIIGFTSCSDENIQENLPLNGKYTHLIIGCDNRGNPEINCVEFIDFIDSSKVIVLIGGGDIVIQTKYNLNNNQIEFEKIGGLNFDVSFEIQNDSTLNRLEDGGIWLKKE